MLSFTISGNYTDLYQLNMSEVNFLEERKDRRVCFDYFFRSIPNGGAYVLFAGLNDLLSVLEDLHFTQADLKFLRTLKFERTFIDYLEKFQFRGNVFSVREGEVIFPNTPVLRIEGNIIEAQIVESMLLNLLNFQSLIATKASRMKYVAGRNVMSEFGLRRSQGPAGVLASRASIIGGCTSTSNVYAANLYNIPLSGTMAHAFIESYGSELEAFRAYAAAKPEGCIFLVDTYDTLQSGVPNAITVAKEMERRGFKAAGIRIDSGDLVQLSKSARTLLNEAGLHYMKIVASDQLDEYAIKAFQDQQAEIDIYGVGTRLVSGYPDAALDGVYKLSMVEDQPKIKISENSQKTTLPGIKEVYRLINNDGMFVGDVIALKNEEDIASMYDLSQSEMLDIEEYKKENLLSKVMDKGRIVGSLPTLPRIADYAKSRLELLPQEFKRFENPRTYRTGVSGKLLELRSHMIDAHQQVVTAGPAIN